MIIFNCAFAFATGAGFFSTGTGDEPKWHAGPGVSDDPNMTASNIMVSPDYETGVVMDNIWLIIIGTGGIAIFLAWITHSTSIIGVYIFAFVFWASYSNIVSMLYNNNFLGDLWGFVLIGTAGMTFIFIGAVAGMLSGSG